MSHPVTRVEGTTRSAGEAMNFNYWDLKQRKRGEIVEVQISGNAANVRLMDSSNFQACKRGRNHRFVGGLETGVASIGKPPPAISGLAQQRA